MILLLSAITQSARPVCHDDGWPKELPRPHSARASWRRRGRSPRLDASALRRPGKARSLGHGVFGVLDHGLFLLRAGTRSRTATHGPCQRRRSFQNNTMAPTVLCRMSDICGNCSTRNAVGSGVNSASREEQSCRAVRQGCPRDRGVLSGLSSARHGTVTPPLPC